MTKLPARQEAEDLMGKCQETSAEGRWLRKWRTPGPSSLHNGSPLGCPKRPLDLNICNVLIWIYFLFFFLTSIKLMGFPMSSFNTICFCWFPMSTPSSPCSCPTVDPSAFSGHLSAFMALVSHRVPVPFFYFYGLCSSTPWTHCNTCSYAHTLKM